MNKWFIPRLIIVGLFLLIMGVTEMYILGFVILKMPLWYVFILVCLGALAIVSGILFRIWMAQKAKEGDS